MQVTLAPRRATTAVVASLLIVAAKEGDQDSCLSSQSVNVRLRDPFPPQCSASLTQTSLSPRGDFRRPSISIPGALLSSPLHFPARNDDGRTELFEKFWRRKEGDGVSEKGVTTNFVRVSCRVVWIKSHKVRLYKFCLMSTPPFDTTLGQPCVVAGGGMDSTGAKKIC